MKKKMPKILTLKRIVFLSVIVIAAIILVSYFVGGYVGITPTYSAKEFSKEGFISYAELEAPIKEEAMELANGLPYNATDDFKVKIEACLHKGHVDIVINEIVKEQQDVRVRFYKNIVGFADDVEFSSDTKGFIADLVDIYISDLEYESEADYFGILEESVKDYIATLKNLDIDELTKKDLQTVNNILEEIKASSITKEQVDQLVMVAYDPIFSELSSALSSATKKKTSLLEKDAYVKNYINEALGYEGKAPTMENADYEFYFDKKWTTFKIVEKSTGNVWYSNPQEQEDFNRNSTSVKEQQKSLINIYYAGSLGGTTMWNSFSYSISDTNSAGDKELTPNFQIKEIKDSDGKITAIQVYYHFKQRNIDYVYFPKNISAKKIKNPIDMDLSIYEELPELYERNRANTTDGNWEEVVSLKADAGNNSTNAADNSVWFSGKGEPASGLGYVGTYYADLSTGDIYVKTNVTTKDSGQNGLVSQETDEYWKLINSDAIVWEKYSEKNYTYNNIVNKATVFEYAYSGNGAPLANEGLNGFYYLDTSSNKIYKKVKATETSADYTQVLSMKEMTSLCTDIYSLEDSESESNSYGYDYYFIKNQYEGMKTNVCEKLYSYLYNKCAYNEEDLIADNNEFSVETISTKGEFSIAIEYLLNKDGLQVNVLDNSIVEGNKDFPLTTVEILPYFTSAYYKKDGYMVIPDGSGAVMNYNNGKTKYVQYAKSVYTTDLSKMDEIKPTKLKDLMFPMYGMINTYIPENDGRGSGVLVDATSGTSQLRVSANVSEVNDSFNKIFFSAFYRESQKTTIGVGYYATTYTKWTEERIHNDITLNYHFLGEDELNYSALAKRYRNILMERFGIVEKDTTDSVVLDVSLVGVYDFRNNFLGINYRDYDTMTTFEQAEKILDELKAHGANHINAYYLGWREKGLINTSFKDMDYKSLLGNKNDFNSLKDYAQNNNIDLYMDVAFGELNEYQESFGQNRYSSRNVAGEYVKKYPYDLSSNVYDKKQRATYVLSPRFYGIFMENLAKEYKDSIGLSNISIKNLGSSLASDYKRHNEVFKHTALQESINAFEYIQANGIENITLYNPYDYALKYTKNALEVPYEATQYEIFDYSIPFYQLVVNGLFDYSGEVINAHDEKGDQWHLMHILETGSNVSFTFSYEDSSKLIQTDYKNYYYTEYSKWTTDVAEMLARIDEIGIHGGELVSHERLANNVYKVKYTNESNMEVEIILNYSDAAVNVEGKLVAAKSYIYNKNNTEWWA